MPFLETRFVGTALQCLEHYMGTQELQKVNLFAEFCQVTVPTVQRWLNPDGNQSPTGIRQLRMICFLELAGYEVREFQSLDENMRFLAKFVALGILPANEVQTMIGYRKVSEVHSLWRILLRPDKPRSDVKDEILKLNSRYAQRVNADWKKWEDRVSTTMSPPVISPQPVSTVAGSQVEILATSFQRTVITATSLAQILIEQNAGETVLEATRGGLDIQELRELLKKFVPESS